MKISDILTVRSFEHRPFFHLIYEWEDDFGALLSVPVVSARPFYRKLFINRRTKAIIKYLGGGAFEQLNNLVESFRPSKNSGRYSLAFELYTASEPSFSTSYRSIPILIDFWKQTDLPRFYHTYRNCKLVLVSSLETFEYLKANNCPLNIAHFPLCLSDRYRLEPEQHYPKTYDILLAGRLDIRTNQILRNYLEEFIAKYPDVEYLHQEEIKGEFYYISNKRGLIGKFQSREDYIRLLRASKISFYSTPGIDGGEKRTGGFNPVTPRYLELLSAQCLLLGKYPKNEETDFYELSRVCPNIESYREFEATLLDYLNQDNASFDTHREILDKHYASRRVEQLSEILKQK